MKKVLITGVNGFFGKYLVHEIMNNGEYSIYGTGIDLNNDNKNIKYLKFDLTNVNEVEKVIQEIKPDYVFHLAAQSSVKKSWECPQDTIKVNVIGTLNLLESLRKYCINSKILLVGSSEEYGEIFKNNPTPEEDSKCQPTNFYAISKLTQNYIGSLYSKAYNMNIVMTRSFNHIGPTQSELFVVSDFCKQVADIEKGLKENKIMVGNLSSYRDFTDAKDIAKAYWQLINDGQSGETYNVGSGSSIKINDILNIILSLSSKNIDVVIDENKYRPIDIEKCEANIAKIRKKIKWEPTINLSDTISSVLNYWRDK